MSEQDKRAIMGMYLVERPPVDIEFQDLTYTVPIGRTQSKLILKGVSGLFKSGQLTAILGPSGAGKSTLLNVLAGYKVSDAGGTISINGLPRDMRQFKKMSRYIMQEDFHQPGVTTMEAMMFSANLKLGPKVPKQKKIAMINEILELLRLVRCKETVTKRLSGGEKKRLSIALELVNNPPVLFLDEPTTGLDDLSSAQCVKLLKSLAVGGRTVICSIHTPSASLFALFDNIYIVAEGQCVFQGYGEDVVPYLSSLGLHCPRHYNPADFIVEVSSGEYGNHIERMVMAVENGKCVRWNRLNKPPTLNKRDSEIEIMKVQKIPDYGCPGWLQFLILLNRMFLQSSRDITSLMVKTVMNIGLGLVIGGLFFQMGQDGSKTLFNFGFCFVCIIVFMYIPMLPALLWFPQEVKLLKKEHFNRWYSLSSYFMAMTIARLPLQLILGFSYIILVYVMSDQPIELERVSKFVCVCLLTGLASEAFGLAISARFNIVNGIFLGPAMSVPFMLLAVYGLGTGSNGIPILIRLAMYCSYLRFSLEGLVSSIYGGDRVNMICPEEEEFCQFRQPKALLKEVGMENIVYWHSVCFIIFYFLVFKAICFFILKYRLKNDKKFGTLALIGQFIKSYFSLPH